MVVRRIDGGRSDRVTKCQPAEAVRPSAHGYLGDHTAGSGLAPWLHTGNQCTITPNFPL